MNYHLLAKIKNRYNYKQECINNVIDDYDYIKKLLIIKVSTNWYSSITTITISANVQQKKTKYLVFINFVCKYLKKAIYPSLCIITR